MTNDFTAQEFQMINNIVELIETESKGNLTDDQKQMIRDTKYNKMNTPDYTDFNYLECLVEIIYQLGVTQGRLKQVKEVRKILNN
jgi:predicted choloylglycine hydrolase